MTIPRKIDRQDRVTEITKRVTVRSSRGVGSAGAPCDGWLQLHEEPAPDAHGVSHPPSIPWDDSWEPGSVVDVTITVTLVKAAPKSRKKCHNPWPAHVHDDEREHRRQEGRERHRKFVRKEERNRRRTSRHV